MEDICELILKSHDLGQILVNIVHLVATRMGTEVCSIYLFENDELRLRATEGLAPQSVGRVKMKVGEGLIGYTAQRGEVVNVPEPQDHPRFRYFAELSEEKFHSFLGIPLYDRQQLIGVMAIQTIEKRDFNEIEISTLTTIAFQLSTVIANARLLDSLQVERQAGPAARQIEEVPRKFQPILRGQVVTPGVAMAPAHVIDEAFGYAEVMEHDECTDKESESRRLQDAIERARVETLCLEKRVAERLSEADASIFHSHLMILQDQSFLDKLERLIAENHSAVSAVKSVVGEYVEAFRRMDDPYLRERSLDVEDIGRRILANLCGLEPVAIHVTHPGIVVAKELMPSDLASLDFENILGVVLESDHSNSHAAIIAKSMGIPTMVGIHGAVRQIEPGAPLILDANSGCLYIEPKKHIKDEYKRLIADDRHKQEQLLVYKDRTSSTRDGVEVCLRANIGLFSDVNIARRNGADGVGLYRTEFPFMARASFPDRDDQYDLYKRVVESFEGQVVTFRTLDIGGDKRLPYFASPPEENPALGWRSVRMSLDRRDMFRTQIEAMLLAGTHGPVRLLFPLITNLEDILACREVVEEARQNLIDEGNKIPRIPLGVMIEVPAAVSIADHLASQVDFFALGTNDLIQYMLAADRGNSLVHDYYDPLHPAILRAIRHVVKVADEYDKHLCICGEMAGDPGCFALLVGLGLREFSVSGPAILRLKATLAQLPMKGLSELAARALEQDTGRKVRALVDEMMPRID